jgi:hypothetical protein
MPHPQRMGQAEARGPSSVVWQIAFMLLSFATVAILIGTPVTFAWGLGWFAHPSEHVLGLVAGGILLSVVVGFAVVHVMTKDFVVPQMALENISAFEGWRRLWLWLKAEKGGYAAYIGMKIGLAIGAGIALTIISLIVIVILLIPIGGLGVMIWMSVKTAGATWSVYTITLAAAAVFFPAYSIYFLAARYPALADLLSPRLPDPVAPDEAGLI